MSGTELLLLIIVTVSFICIAFLLIDIELKLHKYFINDFKKKRRKQTVIVNRDAAWIANQVGNKRLSDLYSVKTMRTRFGRLKRGDVFSPDYYGIDRNAVFMKDGEYAAVNLTTGDLVIMFEGTPVITKRILTEGDDRK